MISLKKGLAFQCQQCSYCCRFEPGFVFLTSTDIKKLASYFKISTKAYIDNHCRKVHGVGGTQISLKEKKNHDCQYWDQGCTVYPARPVQCISYPFWSSILESEERWKKESEFCPGIGKGPLLAEGEILKRLKLRDEPLFSCEDKVE